jgi:predicted metal-binding protein
MKNCLLLDRVKSILGSIMEKVKNPYEIQVFVCTNDKEKGQCCGARGGAEVRNDLKKSCKEKFGKQVRVSGSGCMGQCENGVVAAIYPQNEWFYDVRLSDTDELLNRVSKLLGESK